MNDETLELEAEQIAARIRTQASSVSNNASQRFGFIAKPRIIEIPLSGLLPRKLAAQYIGLSVRCLEDMARSGRGPRLTKLDGKILRYRLEDIDAWIGNAKAGV